MYQVLNDKNLKKKLALEEWNRNINSALNSLGYKIYCSLKAGKDSIWKYSHNDQENSDGFGSRADVVNHLIGKAKICSTCGEKLTDKDILFLEYNCKKHQ